MSEFKAINSFCWLTKGKEIENYIPAAAIKQSFGLKSEVEPVGQYENFFDYLERYLPNKGKSFEGKKTALASKLIPYMTRGMLENTLDFNESIIELCKEIKRWN
ncbi:hypothetical protein D3C71_1823700 [compost metagenome]